jgi:hypothetical protein
MLCLAGFTIVWQDTIINIFQVQVVYNSAFFNLGSWYPHVVGWLSPRTNLISTPLVGFAPGGYMYFWFAAMVFGCWAMRKIKARWLHLGTFGLIMSCFAMWVALDFVAELTWMRLGFYAYAGGIGSLTVFHGHYYQFPIYINLMGGMWYCAYTCLRYFRNDKGETWAERGASELAVGRKTRTFICFLAIVGACNLCFETVLPGMISGLYSSPWPADIQKRSYLTDGICGPGTTYSCPGPAIPVPRPHSAHVSPSGQLVIPAGTKLP